jgi:hypothetical protein
MTGCSNSDINSDVKKDSLVGGFIGGTQGLKISLVEGAPPPVIQDSSLTPFSFIIALENIGESPIGIGTDNPLIIARIGGVVLSDFNLVIDESQKGNKINNKLIPEAAAKRIEQRIESSKKNFDGTLIPGEMTHINFDNLAYTRNIADSYAFTLRAEICYDYSTFTTAKLCFKKNVLEMPEDSSICTLKGPKPFGSSGAPLQITKVEETPVNDNTVQVSFNIEHLGTGMFFYRNNPKDLYDACVFSEANSNLNKFEVFVEPMQKDTYNIDCQRIENKLAGGGESGILKMPLGAPLSLNCFISRINPIETRVYEDMINIRLVYRYGEIIEQPILVQGHI